MSKEALTRRVLANSDIDIYPCGRDDIRTGQVDRRVLATLEFLAASGLRPTVTSLKCGHGYYTACGQRLATTARATRSTSRRSTAPRSWATRARGVDHRDHRPQDPHASGRDAADRADLADGPRRAQLRDGRPCRPHPRRLAAAARRQRAGSAAQARRILSANQWDRFVDRIADIREPGRAHQAVEVLDQGRSASARRASSARATPTWASSRGHGVLPAALPVLPARLPVRARAGRRPLPRAQRRTARTSPWSCSPRCTPSGSPPARAAPRAAAAPAQSQPEPVPITRVTVIAAEPFDDAGAARDWLRALPRPRRARRRRDRERARAT